MDWILIVLVGLIVTALALGWWGAEDKPEGKMARLERNLDNAECAYRLTKARHNEVLARLEISERDLAGAKERLHRARDSVYAVLGRDER